MIRVTADDRGDEPDWLHDEPALERELQSASRLAAVRASAIAAAAPDPGLDSLTRLAARLCGVPVSFVAVVEGDCDRYPSQVGFGEPMDSERRLEGRTFCHYTVAAREVMAIDDTRAHGPWNRVPTVQSLGVQAYLGVPLLLNGEVIGSLCVVDSRPHAWSELEVDAVTELARSAQRLIELRLALGASRGLHARAETLVQAREAIVAQVAHDVRNCEQALRLCHMTLQHRAGTPSDNELCARIGDVLQALRATGDDVVGYATLGSADADEPTRCNAMRVLSDAVATMRPLALRHGVTLDFDPTGLHEVELPMRYALALRLVNAAVGHALGQAAAEVRLAGGHVGGTPAVQVAWGAQAGAQEQLHADARLRELSAWAQGLGARVEQDRSADGSERLRLSFAPAGASDHEA